MKILVDENMPYASELFSRTGEVLRVAGRSLPRSILKDTTGLMVRSTTNVSASILDGTSVQFVGTATAGTDHIDTASLIAAGISFSAAPGCNAIAVVEYVFSALLMLAERDNFDLRDRTVGIVGVGNIGSRLYQCLKAWGVETLLCDPPRVDRGDKGDFYSLEKLVTHADILTFHTSLLKDGPYKTFKLADFSLLMALQPNTILINTCRGEVVDNTALLQVLKMRQDLSIVLDVWDSEPNLSLDLLDKVDIASAHIAGHTFEGKVRGTKQIFEAWCKFIQQPQKIELENFLPIRDLNSVTLHGKINQHTLKKLVHFVYDIRHDDQLLRKVAAQPGAFDHLRKQYQQRHEWSSMLHITCDDVYSVRILEKLNFRVNLENKYFP